MGLKQPNVVIAGGSGFLGRSLQRHFERHGSQVNVLSRCPSLPTDVRWDGKSVGDWIKLLKRADVVVNLAGRSVNCRYNQRNRHAILHSRLDSTRAIRQAFQELDSPPRVWLNSSTSTIYNDTRGDAPANAETSQNIGDDFSMSVARQWEEAFFQGELPATKRIAMRIAIVMGKSGGALPVMKRIARFGLCSPQGDGKQWISLIHVNDFCRVVEYLAGGELNEGVVNVCGPEPILNCDFNALMRERVRPWFTVPQPEWFLKLGAIFMQTQTELILKSRKVAPQKLLDAGFEFEFPTANDILKHLVT